MTRRIPPIAAGIDRFWAVDATGLVTSADGFDWQPFPVATDGWSIVSVTVSLAGDVALLLADGRDPDDWGTKLVMVSHDNGRTWSDTIPVGSDGQLVLVPNVGPAGVALSIAEPGGEREVFLDDGRGEMVFSARSPLGNDALIVGAETVLMPRERLGADGEVLGPVLDVYDVTGELITTVFPD